MLHHTASSALVTPLTLHLAHIARGYRGIGYGVLIFANGDVYWGRGLEYAGGGTKDKLGYNARCVDVCFVGNFQKNDMPVAQRLAGEVVINDIIAHYKGGVKFIKGHREVDRTACPGQNFPLSYFKGLLNKKPAPAPKPPIPKPPAPTFKLNRVLKKGDRGYDVRDLQRELVRRKYNIGKAGADGEFGSMTEAAVRRFQQRMEIKADGVVGMATLAKLGGKWTGK